MNKIIIIFFFILFVVSCQRTGNKTKEYDKKRTAISDKLFYRPDSTYSNVISVRSANVIYRSLRYFSIVAPIFLVFLKLLFIFTLA